MRKEIREKLDRLYGSEPGYIRDAGKTAEEIRRFEETLKEILWR